MGSKKSKWEFIYNLDDQDNKKIVDALVLSDYSYDPIGQAQRINSSKIVPIVKSTNSNINQSNNGSIPLNSSKFNNTGRFISPNNTDKRLNLQSIYFNKATNQTSRKKNFTLPIKESLNISSNFSKNSKNLPNPGQRILHKILKEPNQKKNYELRIENLDYSEIQKLINNKLRKIVNEEENFMNEDIYFQIKEKDFYLKKISNCNWSGNDVMFYLSQLNPKREERIVHALNIKDQKIWTVGLRNYVPFIFIT